MPTNKELWDRYVWYTEELTKHARQIGFAAGGICWLFRRAGEFPDPILFALLLLAVFFVFDGCQFYLAAVRMRNFARAEEIKRHEQTGSIEAAYDVPDELDRPIFLLFRAKLGFLLGCFLMIALQIVLELGESRLN